MDPDPAAIQRGMDVLRAGGLVAFPTETVYGLGANALDAAAVARIFAAKGRPATNPLIVHVASAEQLAEVVGDWTHTDAQLAARFWPGPLSLVLPKHPSVPGVVTGGGATVAVRMPAHPVAERLILAAGVPVAAPSANLSTRISSTSAAHVLRMLDGRIDLVLDAGSTPRGIESTVLDLTSDPPRLLRPGAISRQELESAGIALAVESSHAPHSPVEPAGDAEKQVAARSPGLSARHYAPDAPLECVPGGGQARVGQLAATGARVGWLHWESDAPAQRAAIVCLPMPTDAAEYATRLYAALHRLEQSGVDRIVVAEPPDLPEWGAIRDRLRRASWGNR